MKWHFCWTYSIWVWKVQKNLVRVYSIIESHWIVLLPLLMATFPWFSSLLAGFVCVCNDIDYIFIVNRKICCHFKTYESKQFTKIGKWTRNETGNVKTDEAQESICIFYTNKKYWEWQLLNIIACNCHLIAIWNICSNGGVSMPICRNSVTKNVALTIKIVLTIFGIVSGLF